MQILSSQLDGIAVLSLQTGQVVAKTAGPVIEPSELLLVAFFVGSRDKSGPKVVMTRDIRRVSPGAVVIDSEEDIEQAAEIVRLQALINGGFKLIGAKVETESGQRLGRVEDYSVEIDEYKIQKLHIKPPLARALLSGSKIIDRSQVVNVTKDRIVVRDAALKQPVPIKGAGAIPAK